MPENACAAPERDAAGPASGSPAGETRGGSVRRRRLARTAGAAAAAIAAVWLFRHPVADERLLRTLPPSSPVIAFVHGIASQEKALLANPIVEEALKAFGEDPEHVRKENSGTYWTLFWLTGHRSSLALVEKPGECGGLGWYLCGASAAGWKTKILELLWRVKYVPFLGPLKTTGNGTRYMEFSGHGYLPENGIVLGLDIVDGVLVATLAQDPSLVEELAGRVRSGTAENAAPVLRAGEATGWNVDGIRHRMWLSAAPLGLDAGPFTLDFGTFRGPGLEFRATCPAPPASGSPAQPAPAATLRDCAEKLSGNLGVSADGTFVFAAGSLPGRPALALPFSGAVLPAAEAGPFAAWASGPPYAGRLSIVEAPAIGAVVPLQPAPEGPDRPFEDFKAAVGAATQSQRPRWRAARDGTTLLHFKNLKTNLFGDTPDEDCFWMRRTADRSALEFGTHFGSASAQRADAASAESTLASRLAKMAARDPSAAWAADVDFAALSEIARQAGALVSLARRFGLEMTDAEARTTGFALAGLVALRGLGSVELSGGAPSGEPRRFPIRGRASGPSD